MKKLFFTLTIMLMASFVAWSFSHSHSTLIIRMYNNENVSILIDGLHSSDYPMREHYFRNIEPGRYHISVFRNRTLGWNIEKELIADGTIMIDAGRRVEAVIDRHHRIRVISSRPASHIVVGDNCRSGSCHGICQCNSLSAYGYQSNNSHQPTFGSAYTHYGYNNYVTDYVMSNSEYNHLKRLIKNTAFEHTKERIARQGIAGTWIKSSQLRGILKLFFFEYVKLSFAKYAYDYLADPERFHIVYSAFDFSSSRDELEEWIRYR